MGVDFDFDDALVKEAMTLSGATTETQVIRLALEEYIRANVVNKTPTTSFFPIQGDFFHILFPHEDPVPSSEYWSG